MQKKLIEAFDVSGIYMEYTSEKYKKRIYPKIHSIKFNENRIEYVFTLLNGQDPKEIKKKEYAFYQVFGRTLKIETDSIKKYTLTVSNRTIPKKFIYDYKKFLPAIEGMKLPIFGGVNLDGEYIVWDMADGKPHLLAAGENGSGKSAGVRQILATLIQFKKSSELHLYLCDPKFTEFHLFGDVEHVQGKIACEMDDIYNNIKAVKKELDDRKRLIGEQEKLTGIEKYNDRYHDKKIPYVLLVIDEFAQLKDKKDSINLIETISAQGRAFGIFLLLATQRAEAQVMNGLIKQNITIRMGFRHADLINSRITNTIGSEKISMEDKGRFILKLDEAMEVQAPLLEEEIAEKLLEPYKRKEEEVKREAITWSFPNCNEIIESNEEKKEQSKPVIKKLTIDDLFGGDK
ncbi:FtsK/SpoIIIE domain-containing protein [Halalkalibacter krulwichiae]|uniref:FtsK/SpoIIIE domain-containing protein n=1 Tax=Halalkalibacter krulwichiae TaxID=199441 RepID=UPI001C3FEED3|nr:FtsK/SpoIIIE domain-containing protein [Halalkalibacter krulwichiae]